MKRRNFIGVLSASGGALVANPVLGTTVGEKMKNRKVATKELSADVVIVGGGLGGCAAAMAACRNGLKVILTEETEWIGGQISQQGVPPDEHSWIETHGAPKSYRNYRDRVRSYYKRNYPLTAAAKNRERLNPGDGMVSRICHEPRVCVAVLTEMLNPYISTGNLQLLSNFKVQSARANGDNVESLKFLDRINGHTIWMSAKYFVDATELGDLLPMTATEYVTGTESRAETRELHAPEKADAKNHQAFTLCFAMDYQPGKDNLIEKPENYSYWKNHIPKMDPPWAGKQLELNYSDPKTTKSKDLGFHPEGLSTGNNLNLWLYRRIINKNNFLPGTYEGDITIVNWPQNDYFGGNLIDVKEKEFNKTIENARELNKSFFYWLQTEVPRPDGGYGWPGLRLRGDVMGTSDGMAKYPYIRESRRIKAEFTILEEHVGAENRKLVAGSKDGAKSAEFFDSVGTGYYHIDLHPSNRGNNYIDFASLPFQIPLGSLLPQRMNNIFPANKNIGTTHITNGCYRLHPVEWSIGEAVGMLISYANKHSIPPRAVREKKELLSSFQNWIKTQGLETHWPK
ncbi:FAD-dependent oxidoreductase [Membranihabitans marinus]|uniref:FAD-dependent oxidoreductase n=1 Tax=Membranihabitans marinus TaxID=1227546 RepID=UPI001F16CF7D|nr:FAD-dependent oxidoreductase [Membranihabitans marinus]